MTALRCRLTRKLRIRHVLLAVSLLGFALLAQAQNEQGAQPSPAAKTLRVCADPSNMPFSDEKREGFENKIAALFAQKLGVPVAYYWRPEQMGFARGSLKKWLPDKNRYACDLIISAGSGLDVGKVTLPYYRSTYVMAYRKGHGLDSLKSPDDLLSLPKEQRDSLRIGVFTGSPVGDWLVNNGLVSQMVGYRPQSGGYDVDPGDMISKDLVNGDIDVATVWGPIGGYYAKIEKDADIKVLPFTRKQGKTFDFPVSMGVRYGNDAWLARVQKFLDDNHAAIMGILKDYGVPVVPLRDEDRQPREDDDD